MPTSSDYYLNFRRRFIPFLLLAIVGLPGCEKQEQVASYTVPSHESIQTPEFKEKLAQRQTQPARMLAAIVPHGQALWFFKLQGPPEKVSELEPVFRNLLSTVRFNQSTDPTWTLPDGWREDPGDALRYRTLVIPGDPKLETTVTKLFASENLDEAILANINRWRNQLDLPFIQLEDLASRTEKMDSEAGPITLLNIVGKAKPKSAMPAGMPSMGQRSEGPEETAKPAAHTAAEKDGEITYNTPSEWTSVPAKSMFTLAAFEAVDGSKKVAITISRAGGSKLANVNRWRGQLGMGPLTDEALQKSLQTIPSGARTAELVELKGEAQTMLGAIIPAGNQSIFVKLTGDHELAARERTRFEEFVKSVKF